MKAQIEKFILTLILLVAAGIAPNLFPAAQAGYAKFSTLAVTFLIPSVVVVWLVIFVTRIRGHRDLMKQMLNGLIGGLIATIGLEVVRHVGFLLGGMPGEMPKLMGVLLVDRFALGPNAVSNLAGWGYHFWNGAAFGIIYSLIFGKGRLWVGTLYGILIGVGLMVSPVVNSLGVGYFGVDFGWGFPVTVTLAHIAFGTILGIYVFRKSGFTQNIFAQIKVVVASKQ